MSKTHTPVLEDNERFALMKVKGQCMNCPKIDIDLISVNRSELNN